MSFVSHTLNELFLFFWVDFWRKSFGCEYLLSLNPFFLFLFLSHSILFLSTLSNFSTQKKVLKNFPLSLSCEIRLFPRLNLLSFSTCVTSGRKNSLTTEEVSLFFFLLSIFFLFPSLSLFFQFFLFLFLPLFLSAFLLSLSFSLDELDE